MDNIDNHAVLQIGNEFTVVHVRKVYTRNGERLEIESKKEGTKIHLDPMQLEGITTETPEYFSKMVQPK